MESKSSVLESSDSSLEIQDPYDVKELKSSGIRWSDLTAAEKALTVVRNVLKGIITLSLLYTFIVSLGLMGDAFKILGGKTAGRTFQNAKIFSNPIAGLVLGILVTVLVQSSSTSTSIIITMTAAGLLKVKNAIPMIMGCNMGTSVTNTIVSIAQIGNRDQYRRAFAGATVHDCFNILTVSVLLPIEIVFSLLLRISEAITDASGIGDDTEKSSKVDFLKVVTQPLTKRLIQVDKHLVSNIALATDPEVRDELLEKSIILQTKDNHLFMDTPMPDAMAGWLLLCASLVSLSVCLILLVKLLQSIFKGQAAVWMRGLLNLEFKTVPCLADYVLIGFGAIITILMQSSSITTSTLTPLVGIGLVRLEKMFAFSVGANIGTCVTGMLAAMASDNIEIGIQVALAHLFFNVIGTMIWFPLPLMRRVPLAMAKALGNLAADLPWFPFLYIAVVFFILPGSLLALSMAGVAVFAIVGSLFALVLGCTMTVIVLRVTWPQALPQALKRDPAWMPPSLCVSPRPVDAAARGARARQPSTDSAEKTAFRAGGVAWELGALMLVALVLAVPNAQWANLKYAEFDVREHVGVGAWSACSEMFERDMSWATARQDCTPSELQACAAMSACGDASFADTPGAYREYQESWKSCRANCSTPAWEAHCLSMGCRGSLHAEQCHNVSKAVRRDYAVSYRQSSTRAWAGGERCRPVSEICDNHKTIGLSGNLAVSGAISAALGQVLLMVTQFKHAKRVLLASLAAFCLGWLLLLLSWAVFAGALNQETTCIVVDSSGRGCVEQGSSAPSANSTCVVTAKGQFADIINGQGSYSFGLTIGAWVLLTVVVALVGRDAIANHARPVDSSKEPEQRAPRPVEETTQAEQIAVEVQ